MKNKNNETQFLMSHERSVSGLNRREFLLASAFNADAAGLAVTALPSATHLDRRACDATEVSCEHHLRKMF